MACGGPPCLLTDRDKISIRYRGPSIDATHSFLIHLAKRFQRRFVEINQPETRMACLLTDRDKISILYRGPSIDATYQISVNLGKRFQRRRFFRNQPIKNKNSLWRPCLLADRN
jgi:hypothetical protein